MASALAQLAAPVLESFGSYKEEDHPFEHLAWRKQRHDDLRILLSAGIVALLIVPRRAWEGYAAVLLVSGVAIWIILAKRPPTDR